MVIYVLQIISEYEELISRLYPPEITASAMYLLINSLNVEKIIPHFKWNFIIADPDDNKFVDCALNAGANYIVTNDKHFNVIKSMPFPPIEVIDIKTFKNVLAH